MLKLKNNNLLTVIKIIFGVLLFTLPLFAFERATDTYAVEVDGILAYSSLMLNNGRILTYLFYVIIGSLGVGVMGLYYTSFALSVLCACLSVYFMYKILNDFFSEKLSLAFSFIIILNPLCLEYFLFIEKGMFQMAILFCVLGARFFLMFIKGKRYMIAPCALFIALSAMTYQSIPALFAPVAVFLVVLTSKSAREGIINTAFAVLAYGVGMATDFVILKTISASDRVDGGINFSNLVKSLFPIGIWQSLLIYLALFGIIFGVCCLLCRTTEGRVDFKRALQMLLKALLIILSALIAVCLPFIFVKPNEVWFPFRIIFPLGSLIGIIPLYFYNEAKEHRPVKIPTKRIFISLICAFLIVNLTFYYVMFIGRHIGNRADMELALTIGDEIKAYEEKSGQEITKIAIYYDSSVTSANPYSLKIGDCNVRALSKSWSDVNSLSVYLGKEYTRVASTQQYKDYYRGKDWNSFNPEQLAFEGDTLHLCVY